MQSKVFSVTVENGGSYPYIAMYRTNGAQIGGGVRFYDLTVDRVCRLMLALVNTGNRVHTYTDPTAYGFTWWVFGLVSEMYMKAAQELERKTLGNPDFLDGMPDDGTIRADEATVWL